MLGILSLSLSLPLWHTSTHTLSKLINLKNAAANKTNQETFASHQNGTPRNGFIFQRETRKANTENGKQQNNDFPRSGCGQRNGTSPERKEAKQVSPTLVPIGGWRVPGPWCRWRGQELASRRRHRGGRAGGQSVRKDRAAGGGPSSAFTGPRQRTRVRRVLKLKKGSSGRTGGDGG